MSTDPNSLDLKHGTAHYGRLYPTGYLAAFFANQADRERALLQLTELNWSSQDLIYTSTEQLAELRQNIRDHRSLWDTLVSKFADEDRVLNEMEKGDYEALLIYAPDQARQDIVRDVLTDLAVLAQAYNSMSFSQIPLPTGPPGTLA